MTPEERDQLGRFLQLLEEAQAGPKDPNAQAMIARACARQPDAAYLLVQRVMQLEMAQQASQDEIARLTQLASQAQASALPPSFFGANTWGKKPAQVGGTAPLPAAAAAANPPVAQAQAPRSAWGGGLLGTVASTAVGVVAGSMLAQGIGSMFGNREAGHGAAAKDVPPGGGTLVENDYGTGNQDPDGGYVADDFDAGDSGSGGDVG